MTQARALAGCRLEAALVDVNQELDEAERAGTVRLMRARVDGRRQD